jgi:hypothetical protein
MQRIDLYNSDEFHSIESFSMHLFDRLRSGDLTISDLMGPLYGKFTNLNPNLKINPGDKTPTSSAQSCEFLPKDEHNILLDEHVHPHDYVNPAVPDSEKELKFDYDLVVIGAGVAGLISVIIGAWLGKKCALIEKHAMGGDCLNTGRKDN